MKDEHCKELEKSLQSTRKRYLHHIQNNTVQYPAAKYLKQVIEDIERQLGR